jgi:RNA helicase
MDRRRQRESISSERDENNNTNNIIKQPPVQRAVSMPVVARRALGEKPVNAPKKKELQPAPQNDAAVAVPPVPRAVTPQPTALPNIPPAVVRRRPTMEDRFRWRLRRAQEQNRAARRDEIIAQLLREEGKDVVPVDRPKSYTEFPDADPSVIQQQLDADRSPKNNITPADRNPPTNFTNHTLAEARKENERKMRLYHQEQMEREKEAKEMKKRYKFKDNEPKVKQQQLITGMMDLFNNSGDAAPDNSFLEQRLNDRFEQVPSNLLTPVKESNNQNKEALERARLFDRQQKRNYKMELLRLKRREETSVGNDGDDENTQLSPPITFTRTIRQRESPEREQLQIKPQSLQQQQQQQPQQQQPQQQQPQQQQPAEQQQHYESKQKTSTRMVDVIPIFNVPNIERLNYSYPQQQEYSYGEPTNNILSKYDQNDWYHQSTYLPPHLYPRQADIINPITLYQQKTIRSETPMQSLVLGPAAVTQQEVRNRTPDVFIPVQSPAPVQEQQQQQQDEWEKRKQQDRQLEEMQHREVLQLLRERREKYLEVPQERSHHQEKTSMQQRQDKYLSLPEQTYYPEDEEEEEVTSVQPQHQYQLPYSTPLKQEEYTQMRQQENQHMSIPQFRQAAPISQRMLDVMRMETEKAASLKADRDKWLPQTKTTEVVRYATPSWVTSVNGQKIPLRPSSRPSHSRRRPSAVSVPQQQQLPSLQGGKNLSVPGWVEVNLDDDSNAGLPDIRGQKQRGRFVFGREDGQDPRGDIRNGLGNLRTAKNWIFTLRLTESFRLNGQPWPNTIIWGVDAQTGLEGLERGSYVISSLDDINRVNQVGIALKFISYQMEFGQCGTLEDNYHYQGYLEFAEKVSALQIVAIMLWLNWRMDDIYLAPRKWTQEAAIAYTVKDETCVLVPNEDGQLVPCVRVQEGERHAPDAINAAGRIRGIILAGGSFDDVAQEFPGEALRMANGICQQIVNHRKSIVPPMREVKVFVRWGQTGTGKTYGVFQKEGMSRVYKKPLKEAWWDGYDDRRHRVVLIDEFTNNNDKINIDDMLQWLDNYPIWLQQRYAGTYGTYDTLYITSNLPPSRWFPKISQYHREALLRRLLSGGITKFYRDTPADRLRHEQELQTAIDTQDINAYEEHKNVVFV